ncbi:MAG: LexA family transcriptional regulator [Burkholderiaceae bacterium]|nr:LexA family transcriptional regulator [Burkholderiaceae bacterium]
MDAAAADIRYLNTLRVHWKRNKAFPSMAKMADVVGLKSAAGVFALVGRLSDAGYLQRTDGRIAPTKKFFSYRLLGSVRAGVPQEVDQYEGFEVLNVEDYLIAHPERTSFCTVRGDSMTGAGLLDGDIVVVEHNTPTKPGDIVVAVVDGRATVKSLALEAGEYVLKPENPAYEVIRPGESLEVLGVVVGSFRSMRR